MSLWKKIVLKKSRHNQRIHHNKKTRHNRLLSTLGIITVGSMLAMTSHKPHTIINEHRAYKTGISETKISESRINETRINEIELLEERLRNHYRTAEQIIKEFSPVLWTEYQNGELRLDIREPHITIEGAFYYPEENTILLYCSERLEQCPTQAITHELAHHIENRTGGLNMNAYNFDAFGQLMQARRLRPDAHRFNRAQELLIPLYKQYNELLQMKSAFVDCQFAETALENGEYLLTIAKKRALAQNEQIGLEESQRLLKEAAEFCKEDLLAENTKRFFEEVDHKYRSVYEEMNITATGLPPSIFLEEKLARFYDCFEEHKIMMNAMLNALPEYAHDKKGFANTTIIREAQNIIDKVGAAITMNSLPHDTMAHEQYAAAIASLCSGYVGPWTWPPLNFTLTPDMLHYFEWYEYKGENIFAPHVKKYRRAPGLEEYWENIGIDVPGKVKK